MEKNFRNEQDIIDFFADPTLDINTVKDYSFTIEEWPSLLIKDPDRNMVIGYSFMQSFIALQEEIYHSYALIKYGNVNKKLTDAEKQALQLQISIKEGCTEFILKAQPLIEKILEHMTGTHLTIVFVAFIVAYFGKDAWSRYLKKQEAQNAQNTDAEKYNKALEALSRANERAADICVRSISVKKDMLKPLAVNKSVQIGDISFTQEDMDDVLKQTRSSFAQTRLDDFYVIEKVEQLEDGGFKCSVQKDASSFSVLLPNSLFNEQKLPIIQASLFQRQPIFCVINAKVNDNKIKDAELLDVAKERVPYNRPNLVAMEEASEE